MHKIKFVIINIIMSTELKKFNYIRIFYLKPYILKKESNHWDWGNWPEHISSYI